MQPGKDGGTGHFWNDLESRLRIAGISKTQFAERIGISPQGLSSWKQRNQFRRSSLANAAKLLGWAELNEDMAIRDFGITLIDGRLRSADHVEVDEFLNSLRRVNRYYKKNLNIFKKYADHTLPVLDSLGDGGFFAFSACTSSPYEFEGTPEGRDVAKAIARAISRGVLCLYIRPTEKGVSYYTKRWGYGRVVEYDEAVKDMENFRGHVRNSLAKGDCGEAIPDEVASRWVYERLDQCYVNRSPMWLPGVGLSMFGRSRSYELTARVGISLPGGKFGGLLIYPQYYALEFRFGRFLRKVVLDACREIKDPRHDGSEGRVHLTISKSHRKETERFYAEYSKLLRTVSSIDPPDSALS